MQGAGDGLAEAVDGPCSLGVSGQSRSGFNSGLFMNHPPQGFPQLCPRGAVQEPCLAQEGFWWGVEERSLGSGSHYLKAL